MESNITRTKTETNKDDIETTTIKTERGAQQQKREMKHKQWERKTQRQLKYDGNNLTKTENETMNETVKNKN